MYIGEAAKASGVTIKTIRHYESLGLLPGIERRGSYRIFSQGDIARILLIREARKLGFTLSELAKCHLSSPDAAQWPAIHDLLEAKRRQLTEQIAQREAIRRRLDELMRTIQHCLADNPDCPGPLD
ncbi:MAG: MerR family transcriptional regulator [Candidatus Thiodiazotropha sp.]|jgi:MerR family transcriptional regulator, copper efflux regulator